MRKLPNLELLEYKAQQAFFSSPENTALYKTMRETKGLRWGQNMTVEVFKQTWGSTCLGFDVDENGSAMCGGAALTDAYTTVFYEPVTDTYLVFFDDRICYQVQDANEAFMHDLKNHQLCGLSHIKKYDKPVVDPIPVQQDKRPKLEIVQERLALIEYFAGGDYIVNIRQEDHNNFSIRWRQPYSGRNSSYTMYAQLLDNGLMSYGPNPDIDATTNTHWFDIQETVISGWTKAHSQAVRTGQGLSEFLRASEKER